jgi:hypothetical protein
MTHVTIDGQIYRTNKVCKDCGIAVDGRSRRCRTCNQLHLMEKRHPLEKRPNLRCTRCGTDVSYQSAHGRGRCRSCYFEYRRAGGSSRPVRSADRFNSGTSYEDGDGNTFQSDYILYDDEQGPFTVAHAWACLRKCWKGLRIANSNGDEVEVARYYAHIQRLRGALGLATSDQDWSEREDWIF